MTHLAPVFMCRKKLIDTETDLGANCLFSPLICILAHYLQLIVISVDLFMSRTCVRCDGWIV